MGKAISVNLTQYWSPRLKKLMAEHGRKVLRGCISVAEKFIVDGVMLRRSTPEERMQRYK